MSELAEYQLNYLGIKMFRTEDWFLEHFEKLSPQELQEAISLIPDNSKRQELAQIFAKRDYPQVCKILSKLFCEEQQKNIMSSDSPNI